MAATIMGQFPVEHSQAQLDALPMVFKPLQVDPSEWKLVMPPRYVQRTAAFYAHSLTRFGLNALSPRTGRRVVVRTALRCEQYIEAVHREIMFVEGFGSDAAARDRLSLAHIRAAIPRGLVRGVARVLTRQSEPDVVLHSEASPNTLRRLHLTLPQESSADPVAAMREATVLFKFDDVHAVFNASDVDALAYFVGMNGMDGNKAVYVAFQQDVPQGRIDVLPTLRALSFQIDTRRTGPYAVAERCTPPHGFDAGSPLLGICLSTGVDSRARQPTLQEWTTVIQRSATGDLAAVDFLGPAVPLPRNRDRVVFAADDGDGSPPAAPPAMRQPADPAPMLPATVPPGPAPPLGDADRPAFGRPSTVERRQPPVAAPPAKRKKVNPAFPQPGILPPGAPNRAGAPRETENVPKAAEEADVVDETETATDVASDSATDPAPSSPGGRGSGKARSAPKKGRAGKAGEHEEEHVVTTTELEAAMRAADVQRLFAKPSNGNDLYTGPATFELSKTKRGGDMYDVRQWINGADAGRLKGKTKLLGGRSKLWWKYSDYSFEEDGQYDDLATVMAELHRRAAERGTTAPVADKGQGSRPPRKKKSKGVNLAAARQAVEERRSDIDKLSERQKALADKAQHPVSAIANVAAKSLVDVNKELAAARRELQELEGIAAAEEKRQRSGSELLEALRAKGKQVATGRPTRPRKPVEEQELDDVASSVFGDSDAASQDEPEDGDAQNEPGDGGAQSSGRRDASPAHEPSKAAKGQATDAPAAETGAGDGTQHDEPLAEVASEAMDVDVGDEQAMVPAVPTPADAGAETDPASPSPAEKTAPPPTGTEAQAGPSKKQKKRKDKADPASRAKIGELLAADRPSRQAKNKPAAATK